MSVNVSTYIIFTGEKGIVIHPPIQVYQRPINNEELLIGDDWRTTWEPHIEKVRGEWKPMKKSNIRILPNSQVAHNKQHLFNLLQLSEAEIEEVEILMFIANMDM